MENAKTMEIDMSMQKGRLDLLVQIQEVQCKNIQMLQKENDSLREVNKDLNSLVDILNKKLDIYEQNLL
jgi:hypothetical protein